MAKRKNESGPVKELRIVLSPEAYSRVVAIAERLDQTPASFARQVVMEKVIAFEMAGSPTTMIDFFKEMEERGK